MAHVLLFPSEMKTKAAKSWRDDGFSSFSISRLDVIYEPIAADDMLRVVPVKTETRRGENGV